MSAKPRLAARVAPVLSVVIPVFNEEAGLPALFARLYPALDALQRSYECIFVDDGSVDRSVALLREMFQRRPGQTRYAAFIVGPRVYPLWGQVRYRVSTPGTGPGVS